MTLAQNASRYGNIFAQQILGFFEAKHVNDAMALSMDPDATLDDLREAATTLEDTERTARRVLGGAHRFTVEVEHNLGDVRAALRAREGAVSAIRDAIAATTLGDT